MMIGELEESGVDFHLASQHGFQLRGLVVPRGNLRQDALSDRSPQE